MLVDICGVPSICMRVCAHFCVYDQALDSFMSLRDSINVGHMSCCVYVTGIWACENPHTLQLLKSHLGFSGWVLVSYSLYDQ